MFVTKGSPASHGYALPAAHAAIVRLGWEGVNGELEWLILLDLPSKLATRMCDRMHVGSPPLVAGHGEERIGAP